jgi:uncharacterized protein YccT (UPF0319 family)
LLICLFTTSHSIARGCASTPVLEFLVVNTTTYKSLTLFSGKNTLSLLACFCAIFLCFFLSATSNFLAFFSSLLAFGLMKSSCGRLTT